MSSLLQESSFLQEMYAILDKYAAKYAPQKLSDPLGKAYKAQFHPAEINISDAGAKSNIDFNLQGDPNSKMCEKADKIMEEDKGPYIPKETVELNTWPREMELAAEAFQLFTQLFNSIIFTPRINHDLLVVLKERISENLEKVIDWTQRAEH